MPTQPITYEQLVAYAAGELEPALIPMVESHVAIDPEAAETVRLYRQVRATGRTDDSIAPPTATLEAAKALMAERLARRPRVGLLESLKRIVAELAFDSRPRLAVAGLRGATESYQLSFECPAATVDLEVERFVDGGQVRFRLMGQVTPTSDAAVGTVALSAPGAFEPIATTDADERGVFSMTTQPGRFDVLVMVDDAVIVLGGIAAQ